MSPECWVDDPFITPPAFNTNFPPPSGVNFLCETVNGFDGTQVSLGALSNPNDGNKICNISIFNRPSCGTPQDVQGLTEEQFEACLCLLQAYAKALNESLSPDSSVLGGPPYECTDPPLECAPSIPTLNQWGMIIMTGVLGLFAVIGLFVMRRRNVVMPSS